MPQEDIRAHQEVCTCSGQPDHINEEGERTCTAWDKEPQETLKGHGHPLLKRVTALPQE